MVNLRDSRFGPLGGGGFEPQTTPAERRNFYDIRKLTLGAFTEASTKMEWKGTWLNGEYDYNDVVYDDGWTMICANEDGCTQKPAPTPQGDPFNLYAGTNPTTSATVPQITYGNRYPFTTTGGYINGYRIFTVAGNRYAVYLVDDPDGAAIISELGAFTAANAGWQDFAVSPVLIPIGTELDLVAIVAQPDPAPTTFTWQWNYFTPNNQGIPISGQILHANQTPGSIRIHKTDNGGTDRSTDLATVKVGDTIAGAGVTWSVQVVTDNGTWIDFAVAPQQQGAPDGVAGFTFTVETAQPVTYIEDVGYWPTSPYPAVEGFVGQTYDAAVYNTNAYGADLTVQNATVSDEWELVAAPSGAAATGEAAASTIQSLGGHTSFYETVKYTDILDIGATYQQIGVLSVDILETGVYEIGASATWTFTNTAKSVYSRWRINGGAWNENVREPKDAGDIYTDYYAYPSTYPVGPLTIEVQMRKEDAVGTLDLDYLDLWVERKK